MAQRNRTWHRTLDFSSYTNVTSKTSKDDFTDATETLERLVHCALATAPPLFPVALARAGTLLAWFGVDAKAHDPGRNVLVGLAAAIGRWIGTTAGRDAAAK